ncbi:serine/threonine-protein kinase [Streptomyces litchfieldiae]|uniref:Serine/threonine-protein kinase n=1 Tax=Streptomyces litchfieldiae TaxID=3075543 RepID=A0ABU2MLD1_9ACTN|nr:serine/threonine-protein kinase [Streptomyces sp. DSM 44938]MDT0342286.1 serine/threonine-protein kinase [Streptomyces sp. DSM 44938]
MEQLSASDPRELGLYRPRAVLGEGGMGRVLLATGADGGLVAIKMVHAHLAADDGFRRRFRREVEATRKVAGGHIASVVHADLEADIPWLASEFVHGPALRVVLEEAGALPQDAVLRLAAGLAAALRDIHAAGLVHRDLSPSNVLLAEDGPKVIDFGIVRAAEGASTTRRHTMTTTLTHVGSVIGAPGFMSPEQASGKPLTPATDVFSLGVMLLVACTGRNPFEGPGIPQILYNVVHTEPDLGPVPDQLRRIIEPCLAKDPAQRPTPARLLELIGPEAEASPSWPEEVRRLAERQRAEVHRHIATTDDTVDAPPPVPHIPPSVMSAPTPAPLTQTSGPGPQRTGPGGGAGSRRRIPTAVSAALAASLAVALVVVAVAAGTDDDPETAGTADTTSTASTASNAIRTAEEGDCFENEGTLRDVELTSAECESGVFEVLRVINGSADASACDGTPLSDLAAAYPDITLCLTYRHYSDVYHAREGDCVEEYDYDVDRWIPEDCTAADFTVMERLEGTNDDAGCDRSRPGSYSHAFTVEAWPELDVVLCLSMNYPRGDIGYAQPGDCLHLYGTEGDRSFEFADCDSADIVQVTRRANAYYDDATEYCGQTNGSRFDPEGFPELAYTVCWTWP